MPTRSLAALESMVGTTHRSVEGLTVEAGKVEEFVRALGNQHPVFRSDRAARDRGFDRRPAPPTFLRTALFPRYAPGTDEEFPDRFTLGFDLGFDKRHRVHGEQAYDLRRLPRVGDTLTGRTTLTDVSRRSGEAGTLTVAVLETVYTAGDGERVATERKTILEAPGLAGDGRETASGGTPRREAPSEGRGAVREAYSRSPHGDSLAVGDTGPTLTQSFDLKDFVRYAGASCGFDRIHYDRDFVRDAGYPDAFAHGMLTAGVVEHAVTAWVGPGALSTLRTRFVDPLWPGQTLAIDTELAAKRATDHGAVVNVEVLGRAGETTVVEGEATARLPAPGAD